MKKLLGLIVALILSLGALPQAFATPPACSATTNGTPTTRSSLITTEFQDTTTYGGISPSCVRDLVASMSQGTFNLTAYFLNYPTHPGVIGTGLGQTQDTYNATALQAGINYAIANNLRVVTEPGSYEFYSSTGLQLGNSSTALTYFWWTGNLGTVFIQTYATAPGAPCVTVGDTTNTTQVFYSYIDGISCQYGAAQTNTWASSNTCVWANLEWSVIRNFTCGVNGGSYPAGYRGLYLYVSSGASASMFGNHLEKISVFGGQQYLLDIEEAESSDTWDSLFMNGGQGSHNYPTVATACINKQITSTEGNWRDWHCEWMTTPSVANFQNWLGGHLEDGHIEGVRMSGASPAMFTLSNPGIVIESTQLVDDVFNTTYMSGTGCLFFDYMVANTAQVNNINIQANNASEVNTTVQVHCISGYPNDYGGTFGISQWHVSDSGGGNWLGTSNISIDPHMPAASNPFPYSWKDYIWRPANSIVENANIGPISTTTTIDGQFADPNVFVPATITSFNLTFADLANNLPIPAGRTFFVRRQSGSGSGTLTIKDGGGGTVGTPGSTASTSFFGQYSGTAWANATPTN
jgi:hypothetical protein